MEELNKLESYLKEHGYRYERSHRFGKEFETIVNADSGEQITVYDQKGRKLWDAICGYGSYGWKQGLLEIYGAIVNKKLDGDTVVGWLTAADIIRRLEA